MINNMKYRLLILLIAAWVIVLPILAAAVTFENPLTYDTFEELIDAIVTFIFTASLLLAPIMVLIGAFTLMTAAGNPAKVKTANNIFIYTGVGLLIVFMGKGLVSAIKALMGG